MDVRIQGRRVSLAARNTLGDGGEATVLRHGDLAVKVYHQPSPERARKLEALLRLAPSMPEAVALPIALVHDARGRDVVGFAMRALAGREPLASLSLRAHRARAAVGALAVAALFTDVHATLAAIHRAGVVVGDLNDQNELYALDPGAPPGAAGPRDGAPPVAFIDADSFQLPGHACVVATEAFLDPLLYGPDLAAPVLSPAGPRVFSTDSDWYAFAVLLFRALTLVHPYGGVDPGIATLPRRAAARRSVFAPTVRYPAKVGYSLEVLSDELLGVMRDLFDRGARGAFPLTALAAYADGLVRCAACGSEHPRERRRCPSCAAAAPRVVVETAGPCGAADVIEAAGTIVALAALGPIVRAVAIEEGRVVLYTAGASSRRQDRVDLGPAAADLEVDLGPSLCALSAGGTLTLFALDGVSVAPAHPTATERFGGGRAAFAVSATRLYRIAGGVVLACAPAGGALDERPVTSVMAGQTWLAAGKCPGARELVLGCSRVLRERQYFAIDAGRRIELAVPALAPGESILEEEAVFAADAVALLRRTRAAGVDRVRTAIFARDGRLVGASAASATARHPRGVVRGAALGGASLLLPTDRGVARERYAAAGAPGAAPRAIAEERLFAATEPMTSADALLAPSGDGLLVAHGRRVRLVHPQP